MFSDPGGNRAPGRTVFGRGPRSGKAQGLPRVCQSRGSIARLQHWLSTLRPRPYSRGRKTRFRLRARLYRVGLVTHRVPTKGFRDVLVTPLPPFPSFAWRNCHLANSPWFSQLFSCLSFPGQNRRDLARLPTFRPPGPRPPRATRFASQAPMLLPSALNLCNLRNLSTFFPLPRLARARLFYAAALLHLCQNTSRSVL